MQAMATVEIDREIRVMNGTEFLATLSAEGYDPDAIAGLKATLDIFKEQDESKDEPRLSDATFSVLDDFFSITDFMLADNQLHRDDFRALVVRTIEPKSK